MADKRKVGFSVLFNLLKGKTPLGIIGFIMIIVSGLILLCIVPFSFAFSGVNSNYDYSGIEKNGVQKDAKITQLKKVYNVTVNEVHPVIISYEYRDNGSTRADRFETLDSEETAGFHADTTIKVLAYNHQSMVKGLDPFVFPKWPFVIPAIPFGLGVIMLLIALIPALKLYNLYKTGIIKDAVITSIGYNNSIQPGVVLGNVPIGYYFLDDHQNKVQGESKSKDAFFWHQKKVGDTIKILVSSKNENETCLVPGALVAKYNWAI